MNKQLCFQSKSIQASMRGLVLLEGAIISSIITLLIFAIFALSEQLNFISFSQKLLNRELKNQALDVNSLQNQTFSKSQQNMLLEKITNKVSDQLAARGVDKAGYLLETAICEIKTIENQSFAEITSKHRTGNQKLSTDNTLIEIALNDFKANLTESIYTNDYQAKFLLSNENSTSSSTFFILGRLVIKPNKGILKTFSIFRKNKNIKIESITSFKLQYSL